MKIRESVVGLKSSTGVSINMNQKTCIENGMDT